MNHTTTNNSMTRSFDHSYQRNPIKNPEVRKPIQGPIDNTFSLTRNNGTNVLRSNNLLINSPQARPYEQMINKHVRNKT